MVSPSVAVIKISKTAKSPKRKQCTFGKMSIFPEVISAQLCHFRSGEASLNERTRGDKRQ